MTSADVITLCRQMRAKQKEYFRTHDRVVLNEAFTLESRVDKAIEEWEGGQKHLFDATPVKKGESEP